ncbi:nuclear transport factor 2-like protein [Metabacillus arenae]|uniref:Nuclear transport factor 2 family protein n=1 Tax=Metabacillus arenae TaxID=2771434 RepID=A0A926NH27_9BACI|nr:nuclear transport factor 2 family protein [Metabacillus arenae]MBD1383324.1 nuclear transport factor 2 family protein [Metabacillus arenae]
MDIVNSEYSDLKVICADDCGNAPKKVLLKELTIAFTKNDIDFITKVISDNVCWDMIGDKMIQGKDNLVEMLKQKKIRTVTEIHISNIITHGSTGAVNGTLIFENKKSYAFCDVYNFTSAGKHAKIKEIASYVIKIS